MKTPIIESSRIHVALNTGNIDASIAFYSTLLGIPPSKVRPGYAKFSVTQPPLNLTLNQTSVGTGKALSHLGIEVPSPMEVTKQAERLQQHLGLNIHIEGNTTCCYAKQDKMWVKDPDGREWEIFAVRADTEDKYHQAQQSAGSPPVCCEVAQRDFDPWKA